MAVIVLARHAARDALTHERIVALREWLDGSWGAVFSHPEDFAPAPTTPPGYVTHIAELVIEARIKPIAFHGLLENQRSTWLDHAFNDDAVVLVGCDESSVVDLAEHALASRLEALASEQRFVLIVDAAGHLRLTLQYAAEERPRSTMDILHTVAALRDRNDDRHAACRRRRLSPCPDPCPCSAAL